MSAVETIITIESESQSDIVAAERAAEDAVAAKKQSLEAEFKNEVERLHTWEQEQLEAAHVQAAKEAETIVETYKKQVAQIESQAESQRSVVVKKIIESF